MQNKVVIITGASAGIGRATALSFAQQGARVVVADVNEKGGKETVKMLKEKGGDAFFVKCDVAKEDEVKAMVEKAVEQYGQLDYAFNNAGVEGEQAPTVACTIENWNKVININLRGVWLCMKYEIQQLLDQGTGGSIVNCSSIAGKIGFPNIPAYDASKHGVIGLTKTAALENAKENIRVNSVCPGVIHTEMIDRFTGGDQAAMKQLTAPDPMGRMGQPDEIADAVIWLCSDKASYVTGHDLVIDGGWVSQ